MNIIKFILKISKSFSSFIFQFIFIDLGLKFFNIITSFLLMIYIDSTKLSTKYFLYQFLIFFIFSYTLSIVFVFIKTIASKIIQSNILINLREKILTIIFHSELNKIKTNSATHLGTQIQKDSEIISNYFIEPLSKLISTIFFLIILLPFLLQYKSTIIVFFFLSSLIPMFFTPYFSKKVKNATFEFQKNSANYNSIFIQSIDGLRDIKLFSLEKIEEEKIKKSSEKYFISTIRRNKWGFLSGQFSVLIQYIFLGIMLFFLGIEIKKNHITLGQAIFLFTLSDTVFYSITGLYSIYYTILMAKVGWKHLAPFFNLENEKNNGQICNSIENIELKDICIKFNNKIIFNNFNLKINSNDKVLIIGPSGSGKTTLLDLIVGFVKASSGNLLINQKSFYDYNIESLRNNISYFSQNTYLFEGTVLDNIILGNNHFSGNKKMLNKYKFIKNITKIENISDNTIIKNNGINFSGGERQRIGLARCLFKNFDLLLLDEFGNAIHEEMQIEIIKNILKYFSDKIIICISHNTALTKLFPKIIEIK